MGLLDLFDEAALEGSRWEGATVHSRGQSCTKSWVEQTLKASTELFH